MALGGAGVISVAANVDPKRMVAMCEAMRKGDYQKALVLHFALSPLFRSMFIDTNPIPVKKAVELMGMAGGPVRLPLDELDAKKTEQLKKVLATIPENSAVKRAVPKKAPQKAAARKPAAKPRDGERDMIKVVVCGASGRMGQTIGRMVNESKDLELVGGINLKPSSFFGVEIVETKNAEALLKKTKADVLIDFTVASAAVENVKMAARNNVALVVGTTGITPEQRKEMETAIQGHVPAVISSNFSVGVNIFWQTPAGIREAPEGIRYRSDRSPPPEQEGCPERHGKDHPPDP